MVVYITTDITINPDIFNLFIETSHFANQSFKETNQFILVFKRTEWFLHASLVIKTKITFFVQKYQKRCTEVKWFVMMSLELLFCDHKMIG